MEAKESITLKDVFAIADTTTKEGRDRWTKIGVGFVNRDHSINVVLDAIPTNGRIHIRDRQKIDKTQKQQRSHP